MCSKTGSYTVYNNSSDLYLPALPTATDGKIIFFARTGARIFTVLQNLFIENIRCNITENYYGDIFCILIARATKQNFSRIRRFVDYGMGQQLLILDKGLSFGQQNSDVPKIDRNEISFHQVYLYKTALLAVKMNRAFKTLEHPLPAPKTAS